MPDISPIQGYGYGQYFSSVFNPENMDVIKVSPDTEIASSITLPDSFLKAKNSEDKENYDSSGKIKKDSRNSNQKVTGKTDTKGEPVSPEEEQTIKELEKQDKAVRAHEEAHLAAGAGLVRGGATFSYTVGPDGKQYAVGGEVKIDISPVPDDPQATIRKMEQVKRAALAPSDPSPQDRNAASIAASQEAKASSELLQQQTKGIKNSAGNNHVFDKYKLDTNNSSLNGKLVNLLNSVQS
jgi:hypothetical protein